MLHDIGSQGHQVLVFTGQSSAADRFTSLGVVLGVVLDAIGSLRGTPEGMLE